MMDSTGNGKGSQDRVGSLKSYRKGWERVYGRKGKRKAYKAKDTLKTSETLSYYYLTMMSRGRMR